MQPEALLMVLKNLMRQAYEREKQGEPIVQPGKAPEPEQKPKPTTAPVQKQRIDRKGEALPRPQQPTVRLEPAPGPARSVPHASRNTQKRIISADHPEMKKLQSLREAGILTEQEFQAARDRLLARV
jgi:hypothetical protein